MGQPTPGPWKAWHSGKTVEIISDEGHGKPIVKWTGFDGCNRPLKEQVANARLIAAAPDLLAVCKSAYEQLLKDELYAGDPLMAQLFAAIAKVEGEDA
jgi:hypothetical protein